MSSLLADSVVVKGSERGIPILCHWPGECLAKEPCEWKPQERKPCLPCFCGAHGGRGPADRLAAPSALFQGPSEPRRDLEHRPTL